MPLLLSPYRLFTDYHILESLHVNKKSGITDFETRTIDNTEIRKHFPELNKDARDVLMPFNRGEIHFLKEEIRKTVQHSSANESPEQYLQKAMLRKMHDQISRLKPFAPKVKWYHKLKTGDNKYKTAPCSFSNFRPQLGFRVIKNDEEYQLETLIDINGSNFRLDEFCRYHFLLESRNEYFILTYKDFQTLVWLEKMDMKTFNQDPQAFMKNVLAHLESDYPVDRNNLFTTRRIDTIPVRRVMLSEISNSFLVLTPQWVYEGFIQDGNYKPEVEITKGGEVFTVQRNKQAEQEFVSFLESLHPNFPRQMNGYFYLSFADAQKKQWFLKVYHRLLELDIEVAGMDMLQHFRYSPHKIETTVAIKEEKNNLLNIDMAVRFGQELVPVAELQKMLLAGQKAILLKDGSLGILSEDWLQQYGIMIRHSKIVAKQLQVSKWLSFTEQPDNIEKQTLRPVIRQEWWNKWNQWQNTNEELYPLPKDLQVKSIRPYQYKGYEWMRLLAEAGGSVCLADDMGLGKTLQTICFILNRIEINPAAKHLIICPTSLLFNWQQELQKFAPAIGAVVYHGSARDIERVHKNSSQIIISSYGTIRSDAEILSAVEFDTIVIDESHNIKNPSAQITQAVHQLRSTVRVALSGTPVMNNTFDLYAQLNFLLPGLLGSREFFKREYADPIDRDRDEEKIKALQKLTGPFILRRTKEQVAKDLPEKTETILWCEMNTHQRFAYDSIRENVRDSLFLDIKEKGLNAGKLSILNGILKLRQVCNSCELVKDQDLFAYDSIKTEILIRELENIGDHKALVFSQFTQMLDLLERDLSKNNINYCRLDGSTSGAQRQQLVNDFTQADSKEKVFLLSLKAGNAGLNLTAADYVFLFDPWWNRAVEQQAIDRTHRIGQVKNVFAYRMVCKDTIEEKIIKLQERKSRLSGDLIGNNEEGFVKALSEEDIAFLFGK